MEAAYAAIGRAIFEAQLFETALVPVFEFFKMEADPAYLEKTAGFIPLGAFRMPVTLIVKNLSAKGQIAPELEDRLTRFAEDRHTLVHRWVGQHGWPEDDDTAGFAPIIALANRVRSEGQQLTQMLADYMVKHAVPSGPTEERKQRMAELFHRFHIVE